MLVTPVGPLDAATDSPNKTESVLASRESVARRRRREEHDSSPDQSLEGIGGWLILPAIGLTVGPVVSLAALILSFSTVSQDTRNNPAFVFIASTEFALIASYLVVAVFFFNRHVLIRKLFPALLVGQIFVVIVHEAIASGSLGWQLDISRVIRSVMVAAVWIPYFLVSKRVRATFIEPADTVPSDGPGEGSRHPFDLHQAAIAESPDTPSVPATVAAASLQSPSLAPAQVAPGGKEPQKLSGAGDFRKEVSMDIGIAKLFRAFVSYLTPSVCKRVAQATAITTGLALLLKFLIFPARLFRLFAPFDGWHPSWPDFWRYSFDTLAVTSLILCAISAVIWVIRRK
jgi:hypothetical protein